MESKVQSVSNLSHIGFVVKDVEKTIEFFSSLWDTGPAKRVDYAVSQDEVIAGEPFSMKVGFVNLGTVMLELIQPVSSGSLWAKFLEEHGEGIQHIAFGVSNYDEVVSSFLEQGHTMVTSPPYKGLRWCYFQTQPGGTLVEFRDEFKVVV